jgi:hypothetical protein
MKYMQYALNGRDKGRRRFKILLAVSALALGLLVAGGGGFACAYLHGAQSKLRPTVQKVAAKRVARSAETPESLTSHLLFVGDVFWGRSVQTKAEKSGQGYSYITSKLSAADRAQYDAWIANFECPITTKDVPYQLQVDILKFNCRPEYLANLAKWFTAASQANNHTENNDGIWGLDQTRTNLQTSGIQNFGTYDMSHTDDICEVVTMPAKTATTHKTVSLPVALCGYMYVVDVAPTVAQLAVMQQYAKVMPVIAMPHMGVEYRPTAEPAKVDAYHGMIDNGADMVIGAHPHVIQNSESYKGHLIAYSGGNFLFDQQSLGRAETLGLGVGVQLTIDDGVAAKIYQTVAPSCVAYKDTCLAQLSARLKTRPKIGVSYNFTCYDEASGRPELGSDAACAQAKQSATTDRLTGLVTSW